MSDPASSTAQESASFPGIRGLSAAEVQERLQRGQRNVMPVKTSRTLPQILRENFASLTNVILFGIMIVLVIIGEPGDAFVTGGVVLINVVIGVFQELRAKRQLDRIALLTRPKVTVIRDGQEAQIDPGDVVLDDALVLHPGDQIVVDGRLLTSRRIDVNESLLTGESDFVPKEKDDELLSGSFCVTGSGVYRAERVGSESFANKLTAGAREYRRVWTPLQRQISILVRSLVVLAILFSILLFLSFAVKDEPFRNGVKSAAVVISLVPQGLLLMITVAYALGAVRIARQGALVQQINAVESLSNVDVLCLDKTGTLTTNRIMLRDVVPIRCAEAELRQLLGDFAASTGRVNRTAEAIADALPGQAKPIAAEVPFSSEYKWSGATFGTNGASNTLILGAPEVLLRYVPDGDALNGDISAWADEGLRILIFTRCGAALKGTAQDGPPQPPGDLEPLGWLTFSDELRPGVKDVLDSFREAGVALKLISGDNPQTVAALAQQAGISREVSVVSGLDLAEMSEGRFTETVNEATVFGRITPEQKQRIVQALRANGHYVAMIGDGVNDVLSLKQAQMGIAMESGSQATRSVADMVLLGDKFSVLPEAIKEGQRILNGMQDVMRLFLTRTIYAALLIMITGFIGANFPFTPRHNALLTTLPVGIPAVILTVWASAGQTDKRGLLKVVGEFALPTGFSITIVGLVVYLLYRDQSVELQRTMLTLTALFCGLWLIILAEHPVEVWKSSASRTDNPRRRWLALAMLGAFVVVYIVPPMRHFFELSVLGWADFAVVIAAAILWAIAIRLLWRYDVFTRVFIPKE
jgi:cation-transporting ATPase E